MTVELETPLQDLPRVTVQEDWTDVVKDVATGKSTRDKFWLSVYKEHAEPVHATVTVTASHDVVSDRKPNLQGEDGIQVEWVDSKSFLVRCPAFGNVVTVRAPSAVYPKTVGSVNVLDVSPQGQLLVIGGNNGQLNLLDTNRLELRRELKGHSGDITTTRFFPSGQVVLSGATDFQLRIFSTLDGSCAAVFKGHTGGILDTAIIDRGRNIVSSSRDGEVKLWECATGSVIRTLVKLRAPVNKIALQVAGEGILPTLDREIDHREVGTPGKVLITASDDGTVRGYDVGNIVELFVRRPCDTGGAVISCALDPTGIFAAAGTSTGVVEIIDLRCPDHPFVKFRHGEAAVNDMIYVTRNELLLAFGDGLSAMVTFGDDKTVRILTEYTGPDLDPLYATRIAPAGTGNQRSIWTAGRDGAIRRY